MTSAGKNIIAVKIYDEDCDVCKHMSKHDRIVFEGFDQIGYQEVPLDDILKHKGNLTKVRLYQIVEKYALNGDYTLDLPVYVLMSKTGEYRGHHVGAATIVELRDKIKECLEAPPE